MSEKALDLERDAVHLPGRSAVAIHGFSGEYDRYLAAHCTAADPGRLVGIYESKEDWQAWEIHPAGEELVIVTKGRAEFLQDFDGTIKRIVVETNQAIINPPNVPHTANLIDGPFTAVYITPCPETRHVPRK
jgi:mannose-6-phosphate isomerase-like protein (cupin superfamily)